MGCRLTDGNIQQISSLDRSSVITRADIALRIRLMMVAL